MRVAVSYLPLHISIWLPAGPLAGDQRPPAVVVAPETRARSFMNGVIVGRLVHGVFLCIDTQMMICDFVETSEGGETERRKGRRGARRGVD